MAKEGEHVWQGVCMAGGMHGRMACMAEEMATAVDGTHPTGMHSCIIFVNNRRTGICL